MQEINFAALLCSRLCHDLVSPVGALSNGLEILADEKDQDMRDQVLEMIGQSAKQTAARLAFFRLAFGAAGDVGRTVATMDIQTIISNMMTNGKSTLDWQIRNRDLPKNVAKILLNITLVADDALIRGGTVRIIQTADDILIEAQGTHILLPDTTRAALKGHLSAEALEPKQIPAFMAQTLAVQSGLALSVEDGSDGMMSMSLHQALTDLNAA